MAQTSSIGNVIVGINSSTDVYPWQTTGGTYDGGAYACNGAGGQGLGGVGPNCCNSGKQGDTNV